MDVDPSPVIDPLVDRVAEVPSRGAQSSSRAAIKTGQRSMWR